MQTIQFSINSKYTRLAFFHTIPATVRTEVIITGYDGMRRCYTFRYKGRSKEYITPSLNDVDQELIFEGHDLPFQLDTDKHRFSKTGRILFITDKPEELKTFLEQNCLNATPEKWALVYYSFPTWKDPQLKPIPLFPETGGE